MLYLDTSLIVSTLTIEPASRHTQAWLGNQNPEQLLISEWTATEISSALGIKVRTRQITVAERASALARFHRLVDENFMVARVRGEHFRTAFGYLDQYQLGLRASDALHLAIAADNDARMCTLDQRMATAGPIVGVPTIPVSTILPT